MEITPTTMEADKDWTYDIKCRRCGKVTRMWHSTHDQTDRDDFRKWVAEHSTFPITKQCDCDNGMMMLHDLVSYGNILYI